MSVEAVTAPGVRSEVGRLRTVLLHRPGNDLRLLTPRNNDALLFDGLPWVDRAQEEHDGFADTLRSRGVEVLYLSELLVQALADPAAHAKAVQDLVSDIRLGETLRMFLQRYLADLGPDELAEIMMAGLRNDEVLRTGSLVAALYRPDDFLIDPLPNLLFTRDSSVWIGDRVTITSLAMPARRRETQLTELIYAFHPRLQESGGFTAGGRSTWRAATSWPWPTACWQLGSASGLNRLEPSAWRGRRSGWASPTRCLWCRSIRIAPPCTSTPSAPWSTWTRS
jgi:arginine deiminase